MLACENILTSLYYMQRCIWLMCTSECEGVCKLYVREDVCVCMFSCMCFDRLSQPLRYIEDAKLLSEEVFGLFMEVVQYNNDNRDVSLYSESMIILPRN